MTLTEKITWMNKGIRLGEFCRNLSSNSVGQGTKTAEIYCGDEDYAKFLIDALGKLGLGAQCEIFTIDGEYHVEVKL